MTHRGDPRPSIGVTVNYCCSLSYAGGNAAHMLFSATDALSDKIAVVDAGSKAAMTYRELRSAAMAIANRLREAGIAPGDRVGILSERGARSAAASFCVLVSGGVAILINEVLKPRQISYILDHSGARALVAEGGLLRRNGDAIPPDLAILPCDDIPAMFPGADLVAPRVGHDMAHIIYTSGSTGMPKGVVISHGNVWAGANAVVDYLGISANDRIASLLPFSFDYGLNQLLCCVRTGATLVVERTPIAQRIVQTLFDQAITVIPAVPPLWLQLLAVERIRAERLPSLRVMTNTGGRLPREAVRKLRTAQPDAKLVLMYGLTEAFRSTFLCPDKTDRKPESVGGAIPGAEIMVVREDFSRCAPNEVGELVHRGATVALGYWNDPAATVARFRPNPLRPTGTPDAERVVFSGDLVRIDEEGDMYFVGRRDTMIKSLGHRVSPDEVSDVLYSSGEVVETIIATEPDEARGDAIIAYVVLTPNGDLDRLKRYATQHLPRYMQPVRYEARSELARTSSGKHDARAMVSAVA
jgi:amino acid adenylation domain-containing protein